MSQADKKRIAQGLELGKEELAEKGIIVEENNNTKGSTTKKIEFECKEELDVYRFTRKAVVDLEKSYAKYYCDSCKHSSNKELNENIEYTIKCQKCSSKEEKQYYYLKEIYLPTDKQAIENSKSEELLKRIHTELDKDHKEDHLQKLAVFLVASSAFLPNHKDHVSTALKGNSSAGKDNCADTTIKHLPPHNVFKLTRGTTAGIEDEGAKKRILVFSEINAHRENGANSDLTETFKQFAEGGVSVVKKDPATGFRTTKKFTTKQKTEIFGTTDTASDDELETRFVVIPIRGSSTKNLTVLQSVGEISADPYARLRNKETYTWIQGLFNILDPNLDVIIPYAPLLSEKMEDEKGNKVYLFDLNRERVKRDYKRLLSLTRAITWLHQKQRYQFSIEDNKFLISEPDDFMTALKLFGEFFSLSYSGLDHRLRNLLENMKALQGSHKERIQQSKSAEVTLEEWDWLVLTDLQEESSIGISSKTTLYKYIFGDRRKPEGSLVDLGFVESKKINKSTGGTLTLVRPVSKSVSNRCSSLYTNLPLNTVEHRLNSAWTVLKDELNEKYGYDYEVSKQCVLPEILNNKPSTTDLEENNVVSDGSKQTPNEHRSREQSEKGSDTHTQTIDMTGLSPRNIVDYVRNSSDDLVDVLEVEERFGEDAVKKALKDGDIHEPKKGFVRVL